MTFVHCSKNGNLMPLDDALVSVLNLEYTYGFVVYESVRVHVKNPLFLSDHLARLDHSAKCIGLTSPWNIDQITSFVNELIVSENETTFNLKILLIGGSNPALYIIPLAPFFPDKKMYVQGVKATTQVYERWMPGAKTLNMLPSYVYYTQAKAAGAYDVVFVDHQGNIREGSRTNFFAIRGDTIFSPPEKDILLGVTRMKVLAVAKEHDFKIEEQEIPLANLSQYDGAFLTSTSSKIVPLKHIGTFEFLSIHPEIIRLMKAYDIYLKNILI